MRLATKKMKKTQRETRENPKYRELCVFNWGVNVCRFIGDAIQRLKDDNVGTFREINLVCPRLTVVTVFSGIHARLRDKPGEIRSNTGSR